MQNYNSPQQPQGGFGAPQGGYGAAPPPQKKGMSKGLKIFLVVAVVLVVGVGVLIAAGGVGLYFLTRNAQESAGAGKPAGRTGLATSPSSSSSSPGGAAEGPSPTVAQRAAIAGGQSAEWEQQEISWTVPQRWKKLSANSTSFTWSSPGSSDAASLIANVAPMASDFPTEISLNSYYDSYRQDKQKYSEVRWLNLGGVKGVMFREAAPEGDDDHQRLQWIGYRNYKGQTQYLSIMLATRGKDFARHEDALYGILYSTKLSE